MKFYLRDVPKEEIIGGSFPEQYYLIKETRFEGTFHTPAEKVDGHWLVWFKPEGVFPASEVIGVTSHEENISFKTYDSSKKYAETYVKKCRGGLIDETQRAKESFLVETVEPTKTVKEPDRGDNQGLG